MNAVFSDNTPREALPPLMCVGPNHLKAIWPFAEPLLRKAYAEMDEFMPTNLYQWLEAMKGHLWVGIRDNRVIYAFTTALVARPSGLALMVYALAGDGLQHICDCEQIIAEYARAEGCVKIRSEGRQGWVRALPGYKTASVVFEKELS